MISYVRLMCVCIGDIINDVNNNNQYIVNMLRYIIFSNKRIIEWNE